VSRLTVEDVEAFIRSGYGGKNTHLIIVGPQDPHAVFEIVAGTYGSMPVGVPPDLLGPVGTHAETIRIDTGELGAPRLVGRAWALPPGRACQGQPDPSCSPTFWADQVAISLGDVAQNGFAPEDVDAARQALLSAVLREEETPAAYMRARLAERYGVVSKSAWAARLETVSDDDVNAFARAFFKPDAFVRVMVGPEDWADSRQGR
jgi:predicted Zn-dependent peptidase